MTYFHSVLSLMASVWLSAGMAAAGGTHDGGHTEDDARRMLESMEEMHSDHLHGHDFEVMNEISKEDMQRTMSLLLDIGLVLPDMDSARGATAFMDKGCIVCHTINGIGGEIGPTLDATAMPTPMNAFEFAARMWRGAPAMAQMQQDVLGEMISLSGQELTDLIAFVHDEDAQARVSPGDIPAKYRDLVPE